MSFSFAAKTLEQTVQDDQVSAPFRKRALTFYLGVLTLHLLAICFFDVSVIAVTKVALMPALWLLARVSLRRITPAWTIAILFSWIGDILLLPQWGAEVFFLAGMGAFLIAQLSYCQLLWNRGARLSWMAALIIAISISGVEWGLASTSAVLVLRIGIGIYGTCLLAMLMFSLSLKQEQSTLIKVGALLFVLSDSLIALRMFVLPAAMETTMSLAVMSTYGIAQLGLAWLLFLRDEISEETQRQY